jgi:Flp pilus assembly pilin Flp
MKRLYCKLQSIVATRQHEDEGATMVEYGLIVSSIALIAVVGATVFGHALSGFFSGLVNQL